MKRRSKKILLSSLALLVAGSAGGAWLAAAGRIPALNRWGERKLTAALRDAGVQPGALRLRELTWRRAVAGPIEASGPGFEVRADEAEASLGWSVLRGATTPEVAIRGLRVRIDLAQLEALRGALKTESKGGRALACAVEQGRLELRHGAEVREVPFAGRLRFEGGAAAGDAKLSAPSLRAMLSLRTDGTFTAEQVDLAPDEWRALIAAVAPEFAARLTGWSAERLLGGGEGKFGRDGPAGRFEIDARRPRGPLGDWSVAAARAQTNLTFERTGVLAWGPIALTGATAESPAFKVRAGAAHVTRGAATWVVDLRESEVTTPFARGRGTLSASWSDATDGGLGDGRARWEFSEVTRDAWRTGAGVLAATWTAADLTLEAERLPVVAPAQLDVRDLAVRVRDWRGTAPQAEAKLELRGDVNDWLRTGGGRLEPAEFAAPVALVASLARGAESVRGELKLPATTWRWRGADATAEWATPLVVAMTADREFFSGRLAGEGTALKISTPGRELAATTATLNVKWPRVWWSAFDRWRKLPRSAAVREVLWALDADVALDGVRATAEDGFACDGGNVRARVRGAEVSGESGFDAGLTADRGTWRGETWKDVRLQIAAGFDEAKTELALAHADLPFAATAKQRVRWQDGLAVRGTVSLPATKLAGSEDWRRWLPWTRGLALAGTVGADAETEWSSRAGLSVRGSVRLADASVRDNASGNVVEGIAAELEFPDLVAWRTAPAQAVTFARAQLAGVEFTAGASEIALAADRLEVSALKFLGLGGALRAEPFVVDFAAPTIATTIRGERIQLGEVLRLFPRLPVRASGAIAGAVPLRWQDGRLRIGTGALDLMTGELGTVQFGADFQPLTGGSASKTFRMQVFRKVETAIQELHFNRLHIDVYPADKPGQSVRARIVGAPAGREIVAPVELDFNVNSPLEDFIDWTMSGDVSLGGVRGP